MANFVETEQILELGGSAESSFVQTRGSIPLFWSQTPNVVVYKPDAKLDVTKSHLDGYIRHFMEQVRIYGQQVNHGRKNTKYAKILQKMLTSPNSFFRSHISRS